MRSKLLGMVLIAALLPACRTVPPRAAPMRDYLVTAAKPDRVFVIDPAAARVVSDFRIPDANDYVSILVPSPDGRVAYVLINGAESIAGIDLQTGREVFRANLSEPGLRVKCMFAFDITPDGRELIVYEYPTRLGIDEYTVEQPRFAIYSTAGGLDARPLREFPAPRRIEMILAKRDGRSFFALGFDLYQFDLDTGRLMGERGILNWQRPDHSSPDMLAFWPVSQPTGVFSSPLYSTVTGPGTPAGGVAETSLMTLDLTSGSLEYHDFGRTDNLIFSTVLSPSRRWAYGVYTQLTKIDTEHWTVAQRLNLAHTYYSVNISTDGSEVYAGGAMCDIAIYDAKTLQRRGDVRLPGCGDQSLATLRVIRRAAAQ
ncbi:MAG TPA: quinohemoprotein amine dehydrogenase subunit beta [Steroidobacteraceae bacterium]|nr:quinohemoprotein amine dehydrogenase subunit beta [Steroidobacteraceae bacterium]